MTFVVTLGYVDDTAFIFNGKVPNTVSELLQVALSMLQQ